MRYVAAYLLAAMGNTKEDPKVADVERILSSVGIEAEADKVKKVVGELTGKSIEELIELGATRLASMPAGRAPAASGAAPAGDAAAPAAEEKKKEEKKEESEESDDDMGFGLFD